MKRLSRREFLQAAAEYLRVYEALRRGRHLEAKPVLMTMSRRSDLVGGRARLALGELEASDGHVDEAIRHYQASLHGWQRPRAVLELARLYERAGETQKALAYWDRLLVTTRSGPGVQPQSSLAWPKKMPRDPSLTLSSSTNRAAWVMAPWLADPYSLKASRLEP